MTATHTVLANSLHQELDALNQLLGILQEEQNQLLRASINLLDDLVARKTTVVRQLMQLADSRYEQLKTAGFNRDETGMRAWLENTKNDNERIPVEREWRELVSLTQTAKELNRVNGILISSHLVKNQQSLNALTVNSGNNVYGPDGQQHHSPKIRSVVSG